MHLLLASALALFLNEPKTAGVHELTFQAPGGVTMLYAISVPTDYDAQRPAPLVLVLHPGGERRPHYGSAFMRQVAGPALSGLNAIMVAPDCPTRAWTDPAAESAVMALLEDTRETYAIDRRRVLVMGFSMGGRGTWFMAARHAGLFTAAIPMAAPAGDEKFDQLGTIPTYVIHSRADQIVPFDPAERTAQQLITEGRTVRFEALSGIGHFQMGGYVEALTRAGRWVADRWNDR